MEDQLAQLLRACEEQSLLLSSEEAGRCADLAQQLEANFRKRERESGERDAIHFFFPNITEQCFTCRQSKTVIHLLLGKSCGSMAFLFGAHPYHITLLNGLFCAVVAIFCIALFQETSSAVVWTGCAFQLYVSLWMGCMLQVDIAKKLLLHFDVWYVGFQLVTCFGFFIPMSFSWDGRAGISVLICFGTIFGLMADALPPMGSEAVRVGWLSLVPFALLLAGGYKFKWFVDLHLGEVAAGDFSWDLEELIVGRLFIIILFGCRYVCKYLLNPCDTMYFKTSMSRGDIQERFIMLRELGFLPLGRYVKLNERMRPAISQGPKSVEISEDNVQTLNTSSVRATARMEYDHGAPAGGAFAARA